MKFFLLIITAAIAGGAIHEALTLPWYLFLAVLAFVAYMGYRLWVFQTRTRGRHLANRDARVIEPVGHERERAL